MQWLALEGTDDLRPDGKNSGEGQLIFNLVNQNNLN